MRALALGLTLVLLMACGREEDRVAQARQNVQESIERELRTRNISYPPHEVFIRAFKAERELELWIRPQPDEPFILYRTYPIAGMSGDLGPKRREGDRQVPEGFYEIDRFNPRSTYHLSLGLNYPNARDRALGEPNPGGDIFIHGNVVSIGCLAMTDQKIEEIYLLAADSKRRPIKVHLFPMRTRGSEWEATLEAAPLDVAELWRSMQPAYEQFEQTRQIPTTRIDGTRYRVDSRG